MSAGRPQRFGLITPSGWGNLGDAAIQDAVIQHIHRRFPEAEIIAFSLNPRDTFDRHGIFAYPISGLSIIPGYGVSFRSATTPGPPTDADSGGMVGESEPALKSGLRRIPIVFGVLRGIRSLVRPLERALRTLWGDFRHVLRMIGLNRKTDVLLVSGGGQLDDYWGGKWGHPYTLFKWALISRMVGAKFLIAGVGTCSLGSSLSRFFVTRALSMADSRSFRDSQSLELARDFGATAEDEVVPDLAFGLSDDTIPNPRQQDDPQKIVAVSPMAYCDPRIWPRKDSTIYEGYLQKLAEFCAKVTNEGWQVVFVPSDTADQRSIEDCVAILESMDSGAVSRTRVPVVHSVTDLLQELSGASVTVASRLHGVLLSYLCRRPTLALSYDRKVDTLAHDIEMDTYLLGIESFTVESLYSQFKRLVEDADYVTETLGKHVDSYRRQLDAQFDTILAV